MFLYDIKVLSMFSKKPVPQIDMAKSYFENWNQLKIFILFGTYFTQKCCFVKDVIMLFNHIFKVFKVLHTFRWISMGCLTTQITRLEWRLSWHLNIPHPGLTGTYWQCCPSLCLTDKSFNIDSMNMETFENHKCLICFILRYKPPSGVHGIVSLKYSNIIRSKRVPWTWAHF